MTSFAGPAEQWAAALQQWRAIVGVAHVIGDPAVLRAAETATFATTQRIPLILRPADRPQVQDCLRVAQQYRIAVSPISSGRNWGYGSRVPPRDDTVLLDLTRLNRIVDFNEALAYVTVEPGVTQQQLYDYLQEAGGRLWMDATGSSPECSLIGNTMERGFGHTPYGDHFAQVCGLEVVLPNGACIETGFAGVPGASAAPVYRWGAGPSLDGLFTQSNFGVVTRMTIWLMPAPEQFEAFFFRCDREDGLDAIIDALRPLRLDGTLRSASHFGNDYKVLNGLGQFPWEETGGRTPLTAAGMARLRQSMRIGVWNGSGGLYGTKRQVAEAKRLLRSRLKGKVDRLQFLNARTFALAERFSRVWRLFTGWDLRAALALVRPVYGLMRGVPTYASLSSAYWRKRGPLPAPADMDPDRDGCGLLWCAPVAPLTGRDALRLSRIGVEVLSRHGFEPMVSLTMVTERALTGVVSIVYDREVPGEDARAAACYRELESRLAEAGYHAYRRGILSMESARPTELPIESARSTASDAYGAFLSTLKEAIDPRGILAPGRYGIAGARRASGGAGPASSQTRP